MYSSYFVPGPVLSTLQLLIHLILTITLWYRNYFYPHFTDEETGRERSCVGVPLNAIGSKWQSCDTNSGFWVQTLNLHAMLSPWSITIIHFTGEETAAQRGCSFIHSHTASVIEISCLHPLACNHCVLLSRLRRCSHQKAWYAWFSLVLPIGTSQGPRLWLGRSLGKKLFLLSLGFTEKGKHFPSDLLSLLGPRVFLHTKDADVAIIISSDSETVHYHYGPKDLVTILFYIFITIILHAVVQEYILDVSDVSRFWNWGDVLD